MLAAGVHPLFSNAPSRRVLFLLQITEALTNGLRIARQDPRDVLDPTMPQLGRLDGRLPPSIFLRQPTEESLHLPFNLCCIHCYTALLNLGHPL